MNLKELYTQAQSHRNHHECSAYPYESYQKLYDIVLNSKPKKILEVGTGIGFSIAVILSAAPNAQVDTLEKDSNHYAMAKGFIEKHDWSKNVSIYNETAESFLPTLNGPYDLIFFDGFQIHYEFLPQYKRLLSDGGILILGNNHLASKTSTQFFHELVRSGKWKIIDQFADTTVAKKISN